MIGARSAVPLSLRSGVTWDTATRSIGSLSTFDAPHRQNAVSPNRSARSRPAAASRSKRRCASSSEIWKTSAISWAGVIPLWCSMYSSMSEGMRFGNPGARRSTISSNGPAEKVFPFITPFPSAFRTIKERKFACAACIACMSSSNAVCTSFDFMSLRSRSPSRPTSFARATYVSSVAGRHST